ncbi:MAG TPA: dUTP diphosphatase [Oscillospiraceae bacterium]|nr:dUTP diphosphatase [Oscillospiraceae bacterium]
MDLKIKKLSPDAVIPAAATAGAAGLDLCACIDRPLRLTSILGKSGNADTGELIPTGIAVEIPDGYVGLVFARSGLAIRQGVALSNGVGVIDSDYRGEIKVGLLNHSNQIREICPGDRIAQLVIVPVCRVTPVVVSELQDTARGAGGFGSTGMGAR